MRLDKVLSNLKYGSRKEVKYLIKDGLVLVNDKLITNPEYKVNINQDTITINGEPVFLKEDVHLAIYKPIGYLSANKDQFSSTVFDLVGEPYNRFPLKMAGRLDKDAEGLMILTTSGHFVQNLTHPKNQINKVYETTLDKDFNEKVKEKLINGVEVHDDRQQPYTATALGLSFDKNNVIITIDEGKFHQVKRMFIAVGYNVVKLKRIKIGLLDLGLNPGEYKEIEIKDVLSED